MKQKTYNTAAKKSGNTFQVKIDISTVPSKDRKYSRLKNKAQVFDDRRLRKPKHKPNYLDYS